MGKLAKTPFRFQTTFSLVQLTGRKAATLTQLLQHLREVRGSSIFYHTFRAIQERHFAAGAYANDFADWAAHYLGNQPLAERLANIDPLGFESVRGLRDRIIQVIEEAVAEGWGEVRVPAGKEFCFNHAISLVVPTDYVARDLESFAEALRRVGTHSLFFHLYEARLRLGQPTDDFSFWLDTALGERELAQQIDRLDYMMYPLEEARERILALIGEAMAGDGG